MKETIAFYPVRACSSAAHVIMVCSRLQNASTVLLFIFKIQSLYTTLMKKSLSTLAAFLAAFFLLGSAIVCPAQIITTFAGNGTQGFSGDGGAATDAQLHFSSDMCGVAVDTSGNVYIAESYNCRIRKVSPLGIISTIAGSATGGFGGDGGPATAAKLARPCAVAVDNAGNVYIADGGNNRIRKVSATGIISTIAGNDSSACSGDGGPATDAMLSDLRDVAVDGSGNVYIVDDYNCYRIRKIDVSGIISTYAGSGVCGFMGDGGPATAARICGPRGMAVGAAGNIYIAEGYNYCIRKVAPSGIISTIAGGPTASSTGDSGLATATRLGRPVSVAADDSGNVFVADEGSNRVRKIDVAGIITTIAGLGLGAGFAGDGGPATAAKLAFPAGIAVDKKGNIYFGDSGNSRIRKVSNESTAVPGLTGPSGTSLSVFPNPARGAFSIIITSPVTSTAAITITDLLGREIEHLAIPTNNETGVQLHVPAGIYLLSARTGEARIVEKIVVE